MDQAGLLIDRLHRDAHLGDAVIAAWGDNRNPWTSPPDSLAAGTHPQPDVFAKTVISD